MANDIEKELKEEEKEVKHERVEMQMEAPPRAIRWDKMGKAGLLIIVVGALFLFIGYKYGKESGNEATETTATETAATTDDSATTVASASAATDATADWKTYTNSRVNYSFKYPTSNLTLALDESIKYPSTDPANSKTEDLVQFAVGETAFGVRATVGVNADTIESWIQNPDTVGVSHDLAQYEKTSVGGLTAYRRTGEASEYVLSNGNIYLIDGHRNTAPVQLSDEPLFEQWTATFQFTQ